MSGKSLTIKLSPEATERFMLNAARAGFPSLDDCVEHLLERHLPALRKAKEESLAVVLLASDGSYAGSIGTPATVDKSLPVHPLAHPINIPTGRALLRSINRVIPEPRAGLES